MNETELDAAVGAIIFASGSPVPSDRLCGILDVSAKELAESAERIKARCDDASSGVSLITLEGGYQFCTKAYLAPFVKQALEVLAVIAYNQPVTRSFIEAVRGVDSAYIVTSLADKGLIAEGGQLDAPGRPTLFVTTDAFLRCFGLSSLSELPDIGTDNPHEGMKTLTALAEQEPEAAADGGAEAEQV